MIDRNTFQNKVVGELTAESDRGCILVGASVLDEALEDALKAALVTDPHAVKNAVTPLFESMGPLATFSAKIKLTYGLGLIPRYCFNDLEQIRRIRNIAAHQHSNMTFETEKIVEISRTLESADHVVRSLREKKSDVKPETGLPKPHALISKERMRFILTVGYIAGYLAAKRALHTRRRIRVVPQG